MVNRTLNTCTDEELMEAIALNDAGAFAELYDRYSVRLLNYLYKWLQDKEKANDFLQDLFVKVIDHATSFDTTKKCSTWIYALATNMCRNEFRNSQNRNRILQSSFKQEQALSSELNLDKLDYSHFRSRLQEVLNELNEELRSLFLLRFQEELSIKEIAEIIAVPEGTVKSRLFYLLKKMAHHLAEFNPAV